MSTTLPVDFHASPLPTNFVSNPQGFLDAIVERLSITSQTDLSFFVTGVVAPTSNVGPWLKDGITWYVWDTISGAYVPETLEFQSLRWTASMTDVDQNKYVFFIQLDAGGKATSIKYYYTGVWRDVYEDKFLLYPTTTQMNTTIGLAISLAVGNLNPTPASAKTNTTESVPVDAAPHKVLYNLTNYDPDAKYDAVNSRYYASVTGIYQISANVQVDNDTATASSMEIHFSIGKNGNPNLGPYDGVGVSSPPGGRWYPSVSGGIFMNAGEYLEIFITLNDGVLSGNVNLSNGGVYYSLVKKY